MKLVVSLLNGENHLKRDKEEGHIEKAHREESERVNDGLNINQYTNEVKGMYAVTDNGYQLWV